MGIDQHGQSINGGRLWENVVASLERLKAFFNERKYRYALSCFDRSLIACLDVGLQQRWSNRKSAQLGSCIGLFIFDDGLRVLFEGMQLLPLSWISVTVTLVSGFRGPVPSVWTFIERVDRRVQCVLQRRWGSSETVATCGFRNFLGRSKALSSCEVGFLNLADLDLSITVDKCLFRYLFPSLPHESQLDSLIAEIPEDSNKIR